MEWIAEHVMLFGCIWIEERPLNHALCMIKRPFSESALRWEFNGSDPRSALDHRTKQVDEEAYTKWQATQ